MPGKVWNRCGSSFHDMAYKKMPVEMRAVKVIQNGVLAGVHVGGRAGQVALKVW